MCWAQRVANGGLGNGSTKIRRGGDRHGIVVAIIVAVPATFLNPTPQCQDILTGLAPTETVAEEIGNGCTVLLWQKNV